MSACLVVPGGCGAGLITGAVAGGRGGGRTEASPPELNVAPVLPLVASPNTTRTVLVTNAQLIGSTDLKVRIAAAGVEVDQLQPTASPQGSSTSIAFGLDTAAIAAAIGDPTAADVPATLTVLVGAKAVAQSVPVILARQPRATLVLSNGQQQGFLSPFGERVKLRVEGLRSADPADVQVLVTTLDPANAAGAVPATITRSGSDVRFEDPEQGAPVVSVTLPGNAFPVAASLIVRDAIAGQSTEITNAYYRPDITQALPSQGPTTGGTLLTLIGTALVPHDFTTGATSAPFDFDAVSLSFAKGERVTPLPRADFRSAESGSDRLVFTMPPSPDGRPGRVDIVLRVELGGVSTEVIAGQVFLFANPDPFFGPRGVVLDRLPVSVAPIELDAAPNSTGAPDFVALTDPGGVAFLQLLLAQQNGMFQPFAAPRRIGNPEVPAERTPRALCVGDFDGDHVPDVFLVNEGANGAAVHHLVLGQARPLPPLGAVFPVPAAGGSWRCRAAFFDGDALPDVLLVPGPNAPRGQRPQILLARPHANGDPAFDQPIEVPVDDFAYEAVEVADLDGDQRLDVALVSGTELRLEVAYGLGDGHFTAAGDQPLDVPGYTPSIASPAVGLHACADGSQQSLCLVLSGLLRGANNPTRPTIAVLRQSSARTFESPTVEGTVFPPTEPIGRSLAADLDQNPPIELMVAVRDEPLVIALGLLQLGENAFVPLGATIEQGILGGAESPRQIRALVFDTAFPATPLSGEAKAVFIVHETEIDGARERRLSTRLVASPSPDQPLLLPPDAGDAVDFPIARVVGGNFHPVSVASGGAARDLALVRRGGPSVPEAIFLVENDGFGGFPRLTNQLVYPGAQPDSLTLLPSPPGSVDALLFCAADSRVVHWQPDTSGPQQTRRPSAVSDRLRDAIADPSLNVADLDDGTRMQVADVDGDGIVDLVVLASFAIPTGEGRSRIALCRGKAAPAAGEFPFHMPTQLTPVHGNASAFALGDFAVSTDELTARLELAVTVPTGTTPSSPDGDHIRMFRYEAGATPADDRFVPTAVPGGPQVLLAGSQPTAVAAADLDRDGRTDLLVACRGDSKLRLFRNTAAPTTGVANVDIGAFVEALPLPNPLAIGEPTLLRLVDVNGDQILDAVAFVEFVDATGARSTSVAVYLSSGTGVFTGPLSVSPTRVGDRDAILSGDLGDWNRDGVPDLFLGWDTSGPNDINLRVLFGGTR